jgi:hypothetical protein
MKVHTASAMNGFWVVSAGAGCVHAGQVLCIISFNMLIFSGSDCRVSDTVNTVYTVQTQLIAVRYC